MPPRRQEVRDAHWGTALRTARHHQCSRMKISLAIHLKRVRWLFRLLCCAAWCYAREPLMFSIINKRPRQRYDCCCCFCQDYYCLFTSYFVATLARIAYYQATVSQQFKYFYDWYTIYWFILADTPFLRLASLLSLPPFYMLCRILHF